MEPSVSFGAKEGIACLCLVWYVLLDLHTLQFSMCKALKRVLFKQRHRKVVVEPNFWYHDEIPLTEFQFVKVSSMFFPSPPPLFLLTYLHTFLPSFIIPQSPSFSCNQFHMSFEPYGLGFLLLRLESAPKIHYMISFLCSLLHFTVSGLKSWSVFLCSVQPTEY